MCSSDLAGRTSEDRQQRAEAIAADQGLAIVPPFDHADIVAGQATVGLEIAEQLPDVRTVVVPVGGGGLIAGVACAIKELRPEVKIVGVETARLPSMQLALEKHELVTIPAASTIADGIAVRRAGELRNVGRNRLID